MREPEFIQTPVQLPRPQGTKSDPVCNGTGWLYQVPNGYQMKCWRCVGTGMIVGDVSNKPNGPISPEAEGDPAEGGGEGHPTPGGIL